MKKYFFEFDETGTIHKTIYYDAVVVPAQTVGEGRQMLEIDASGLPQEQFDGLNNARMRPHLYQVVAGEMVVRDGS